MFNVHASGSFEMMRATVDERRRRVPQKEGLAKPKLLAVTVLTSLSRDDSKLVGVQAVRSRRWCGSRASRATRRWTAWSRRRTRSRASPRLRPGLPLIVTPGVRPKEAGWDDQKRDDARRGDPRRRRLLVVARPIIQAKDR